MLELIVDNTGSDDVPVFDERSPYDLAGLIDDDIERLPGHVAFAVCAVVGLLVGLPVGIWLFL